MSTFISSNQIHEVTLQQQRAEIMAKRRAQPGWTPLHEQFMQAQEEITMIQHLRDRGDFVWNKGESSAELSNEAWDRLVDEARTHTADAKAGRAAKMRTDAIKRIQQMSDTARFDARDFA